MRKRKYYPDNWVPYHLRPSTHYPPATGQALLDRFNSKWMPEPNTGCWLWMAAAGRNGYGTFSAYGMHTKLAHRLAWMFYRGPIPEGMVIDHMCRVRSCVNPDHLRVVTKRQNCLENSISPYAINAARTCCSICGGEFTAHKRGRFCRACRARRVRKYAARRRNNQEL